MSFFLKKNVNVIEVTKKKTSALTEKQTFLPFIFNDYKLLLTNFNLYKSTKIVEFHSK